MKPVQSGFKVITRVRGTLNEDRQRTNMLEVQVTNVSKHGFWLLLSEEELFVPFSDFPWFKAAPVAKLMNVERPQPHHLHWPDLDVDLAVDSIRHPEQFPLVSRS
jgi:hypothetical protein